jgi:hypothetical protein
MGIFGFLSKAHSDQSLVSGDVLAKISVYDEKIKTSKDNIDANRKALKQLDEAVDQVMGRSNDEKGAEKAVSIRRSQQKERARLQAEIQADQKAISILNEERSPIAAEVRKVEAEVGPIKYIAAFVYGATDETILEKAVTWVIIILIVVFDPLAVILLLSSQISFQTFRQRTGVVIDQYGTIVGLGKAEGDSPTGPVVGVVSPGPTVTKHVDLADEANALIAEIEPEEVEFIPPVVETTEGDSPEKESDVVSTATVTKSILEQHPYLNNGFTHFEDLAPMVFKPEPAETKEEIKEYLVDATLIDALEGTVNRLQQENDELRLIAKASKLTNDVKVHGYSSSDGIIKVAGDSYTPEEFKKLNDYVQNEEQNQSSLWNQITGTRISEEEYIEQASKKKE